MSVTAASSTILKNITAPEIEESLYPTFEYVGLNTHHWCFKQELLSIPFMYSLVKFLLGST